MTEIDDIQRALGIDGVRNYAERMDALAEERLMEITRLRAALEQIATCATPCTNCEEVHEWTERHAGDPKRGGSWAHPRDGHSYYRYSAESVAKKALAGSGFLRGKG